MKLKKFFVIIVVMIFLLTAAGAIQNDRNIEKTEDFESIKILNSNINFLKPQIIEEEDFTNIKIINIESTTLGQEGKPLLPVKKMVYEFPMGTVINEISLSYSNIETTTIEKPIKPAPLAQPYSTISTTQIYKTRDIYSEVKSQGYDFSGFYPETWFDYSVRVGLNKNNERTTFVTVNVYPVRYSASEQTVKYISNIDLEVKYDSSNVFKSENNIYDFLIISAPAYLKELERLVEHKEKRGIKTNLVSVDTIDGLGRDSAEQIKYFIKDSIEETGIKYVMLVGGYRGFFGFNRPRLQIPTRYIHLDDGSEPGYVGDLYYADIYLYDEDTDTYEFSSWDTNNNEKYGEWYYNDINPIDEMDLLPDINIGRLACRRVSEARIMVDKIINYENNEDKDWFEKIYVISGDDFQDQPMLDIQWDTMGLQGEFTIHAESTNKQNETGPKNTVTVTVDHSRSSSVTFSETDHLTTDLNYPHPPVAEITVPSDGNILGDDDVLDDSPPGAYIGERWTPIIYEDKIMHIMGKSYNPQPQTTHGVNTTIKVWITDETDETIFGPVEKQSNVWFEGEWSTKKALDYMPESFEKIKLWTSLGTLKGTPTNPAWAVDNVVNNLSTGAGFVYIAGHASPMVWADHYPGIPGGRRNGDIIGLQTMDIGLIPRFPLNAMTNQDKLPVMIISGCSPSKIDVNFLNLFRRPINSFFTSTWAFESLGWWINRIENGGTIATIGPTALGYGYIGEYGTEGLGGWLWAEFFRQYSVEEENILGKTHSQSLTNYIKEFGPDLGRIDTKTVQEMILLGDPTLEMG